MFFEHKEVLFLLIIPIFIIFFKIQTNYKRYFSNEMFEKIFVNYKVNRSIFILLTACYVFIVLAMAKPVLQQKYNQASSKIDIVVALDMSKSMTCKDVYPSRFAFAKAKLKEFINQAYFMSIAVIGFSNFSFLIASSTHDKTSLIYLINHVKKNQIFMRGTNILNALKSTNWLLREEKNKIVVFFTDGGNKTDFIKEIKYANIHHIKVFVCATATIKGGVIKTDKGILTDSEGNIVVTRLNPAIRVLCQKTGGFYIQANTTRRDIDKIIDIIKARYAINKQRKKQRQELYFIPLSLAVFLFFISLIGIKR